MSWVQWGHKREVASSLWGLRNVCFIEKLFLKLRLKRRVSVDQTNETEKKDTFKAAGTWQTDV